jgi:single-strand DNA-binding protein
MNKCFFLGNLGRDNELKYTASGKALCVNSMAVTERWKTAEGEKKEKTTWVRFTIWGKRGEIFAQYTQKGSKVLIEGRLQIDKVEKNGTTTYYTSINVDDFTFLSRKPDGASAGGGAALPDATAGAAAAGFAPPQGAAALPAASEDDPWSNPAPDTAAALPDAAALPGADQPAEAALPETAPESTEVASAVPEEDLPW